jgi:hypothetical protein
MQLSAFIGCVSGLVCLSFEDGVSRGSQQQYLCFILVSERPLRFVSFTVVMARGDTAFVCNGAIVARPGHTISRSRDVVGKTSCFTGVPWNHSQDLVRRAFALHNSGLSVTVRSTRERVAGKLDLDCRSRHAENANIHLEHSGYSMIAFGIHLRLQWLMKNNCKSDGGWPAKTAGQSIGWGREEKPCGCLRNLFPLSSVPSSAPHPLACPGRIP